MRYLVVHVFGWTMGQHFMIHLIQVNLPVSRSHLAKGLHGGGIFGRQKNVRILVGIASHRLDFLDSPDVLQYTMQSVLEFLVPPTHVDGNEILRDLVPKDEVQLSLCFLHDYIGYMGKEQFDSTGSPITLIVSLHRAIAFDMNGIGNIVMNLLWRILPILWTQKLGSWKVTSHDGSITAPADLSIEPYPRIGVMIGSHANAFFHGIAKGGTPDMKIGTQTKHFLSKHVISIR
mmetsp:Transcript_14179/g.32822  ORF Transcript_14179/g.32822 Transcript_14179/m.32822 type:complete len:232 (+) Transcript_14179:1088-1783(+)